MDLLAPALSLLSVYIYFFFKTPCQKYLCIEVNEKMAYAVLGLMLFFLFCVQMYVYYKGEVKLEEGKKCFNFVFKMYEFLRK